QNVLISRLGVQGVRIRTEFRYARVLNGFAAALDARALSLLERAPEVAGVYPVRAAYPSTISSRALRTLFAAGSGHRPVLSLPGYDGRGVTIALLDTGVDRAQPFLRGRIAQGIDIVGGNQEALAAPKPDDQTELERHGTEMAGLLVGAGGPYGLAGVATGASVLPIRVAGWQEDATGGWSVYARSDQIVAGLESAVDPNGDDDAHDAARIALVALAEPYAAFADDPVALAAGGAPNPARRRPAGGAGGGARALLRPGRAEPGRRPRGARRRGRRAAERGGGRRACRGRGRPRPRRPSERLARPGRERADPGRRRAGGDGRRDPRRAAERRERRCRRRPCPLGAEPRPRPGRALLLDGARFRRAGEAGARRARG